MTEQEEVLLLKEYFYYDPITGVVSWKKSPPLKRNKEGTIAGTHDSYGYRVTKLHRKMYKIHRIAWVIYYGRFPEKFIDHINGIPDDNRICNLRDASVTENAQNKYTNRAGKLVGVSKNKGSRFPYTASITISKEHYNIGRFPTEEMAHNAYMEVYAELCRRGFNFNESISKNDFLEKYGSILWKIKPHAHSTRGLQYKPYISEYRGRVPAYYA